MTRSEKVLPGLFQELAQVQVALAALQNKAAILHATYTQKGGATMDGIDTYDFTAHAVTKQQFTDGMTDLVTTHNVIGLSTIVTGGGFARVILAASGA